MATSTAIEQDRGDAAIIDRPPAAPAADRDAGGDRDPGTRKGGSRQEGSGDEGGRSGRGEAPPQDGKKSRWPLVVLAIVGLLAIIGGGIYWFLTRNLEDTNDAYTEGNAVSITSKVSGYVVERRVDDNQVVKAGDLMIRIDPRDYVNAVDQAQANLDLARSQLASAEVDLAVTKVRAPADLEQATAQLAQAQANQTNARLEYRRQHAVDPRATTQTSIDQANSGLAANDAQVKSAQAQVRIASLVAQTIKTAEDTVQQRQAQVEQAEANLAQAKLNLSYTELRAPQDGMVTRRNVDVGTYAQAGQQMFYLVAPQVWVVANFKETQLARMRVGQPVSMTVDAFPNLKLHGHIDSFQDGSGARFSAFPAENATGNFVKIVRRVPVKIVIDSGLDPKTPLPLGISVEPTVNVE